MCKSAKTLKLLLMILWTNVAHCSVAGINYMDPINMGSIKSKLLPGDETCNSLYWYPRNIPDFCKFSKTVRPTTEEPQAAEPSPPAAPGLIPMPPRPVPILPPPIPILPPPFPILPIPPLPIIAGPLPSPIFNGPLSTSIASNPYSYINPLTAFSSLTPPNSLSYYPSYKRSLTGFVPGIQGLVTKDGGINIMPFSDVYSDMLEKHKNKIIRRKLRKILDQYERSPHSRDYGNLLKYDKYFTYDE